MRGTTFLVIGFLAVGLLPISSGFAQENDYLIVPTRRVGKWGLSKPADAYGLGQPTGRWEGKASDGRPYSDAYAFLVSQAGPVLHLHACKSDGLTFAIYAIRRVNLAPDAQPEALKYKTADGIGIGSDVGEITRALGNPRDIGGWTERHGQIEVSVAAYNYMGLNILVSKADNKAFGIGVSTEGAWGACQQAVLGGPAVAQTVPVTVALPVPMPGDLRITLPSSGVPPNRAAFSGVWVGKWDNILDTALVVQEFTTLGISGVYAWGTAASWNIHRPGWSRVNGRFAGPDELHVQMGSILVVYRMRPDGRLDGVYGGQARTTLTKVFPK